MVCLIYAISGLVFYIGLASSCSIGPVLTRIVRRISQDGKQRHLVYMKGASTSISHSAAAWPDPWLLSLRHIPLPTECSLHGIALNLRAWNWRTIFILCLIIVIINRGPKHNAGHFINLHQRPRPAPAGGKGCCFLKRLHVRWPSDFKPMLNHITTLHN